MNKDLQMTIQMFVDQFTAKTGEAPTMDILNDFMQHITADMNSRARENFDGYSSEQMHQLIDFLWSERSPISLGALSDEELEQIPLLRQINCLSSILLEKGKIKLTVTGSLPLAVVREVYSVGILDRYIEEHQSKRLTEADAISVQRTLIMLKLLGATKVQKGVMTLTANGKKLIKDKHKLFQELMQVYTYRFNWAYFDGYDHEDVGRMGAGFSLMMVAKYGSEWKISDFYAQKYFEAFPILSMEGRWRENVPGESCYTIRTFTRFMLEFGIIEMREERVKREDDSSYITFDTHHYIRKTELFDKMIIVKR